MWSMNGKHKALAAVAATAAIAVSADAAEAVEVHDEYAADVACPFALAIDGTRADRGLDRTFVDAGGTTVRALSAGRGFELTFTNLSTGATFHLPASGAASHTEFAADGTQTLMSTGHNVIILFPADDPEGPSTTLYVGRVVTHIDENQVWTVLSTHGRTTDICAALS